MLRTMTIWPMTNVSILRQNRMARAARAWLLVGCLGALAIGCQPVLNFDVTLEVVDEDDLPVGGAVVAFNGTEILTNGRGQAGIGHMMGAMLAVVSADGFLPEPVVVGRDDSGTTVRVRLLADKGGLRWAMHATGDVMFGRRYNDPGGNDEDEEDEEVVEPLIPAANAEQATRDVVEHIAPAFSIADLRTVNLETVVSELPDSAIYERKRFILNSWPQTVAGLDELKVDAVDLANNHARDYMDIGVQATLDALDAAGIPHFGASVGPVGADQPLLVEVKGVTVGMLGFTTVEGSFVNDNYPDADEVVPIDLPAAEAWQYDTSSWGYTGPEWDVPVAERRIGEVWRMFKDKEDELSEQAAGEVWQSMAAVYPGLQDWVARRGHGGAALYTREIAEQRIADLQSQADVIVVQLHSGFQFLRAPSSGTRIAARRAIDAGADIVIAHHPHVLQGAEWYKGKLIVYSLGNFIFDQDFLATFSSAFLRTVWEGDQLIEARFVPVELIGYKTRPVADRTARRTLMQLWEMSVMRAQASRDPHLDIHIFEHELDSDTVPANLRIEHSSARIVQDPVEVKTSRQTLGAGRITPIPYPDGKPGLIDPRLGLSTDNESVYVGRDMLGWGHFEDEVADGLEEHNAHWDLPPDSSSKQIVVDGDTDEGVAYLKLSRHYTNDLKVLARTVARVPLPQHRLNREREDGYADPLDPAPVYSLRFRGRRKGTGQPFVRIVLYHFYDINPTADPYSLVLEDYTEEIAIANDIEWHDIVIDIPKSRLEGHEKPINMALVYIGLEPPYKSKTTFDIDGLQFVEWRQAGEMPDRMSAFDFVRNDGDQDVELTLSVMPATDD